MKTSIKLLALIALVFSFVFSCKKPVEPDQATTNDVRNAELAQSDVFTFTQGNTDNGKSFTDDSSCVSVDVIKNADGSYTTTITFDSTCAFEDEVIRSGQIIINWTPGWRMDSTKSVSITFNDFARNRIVLNGDVSISFVKGSFIDSIPPKYKMVETNMSIQYPDGKTSSWSGNRTVEWLQGFLTPRFRFDDIRLVNFHREGINRNGESFVADGNDLLIKNSCGNTRRQRVVSGTIVINKGDVTTTVDFGNGDCDDTFTIAQNGTTITING